MRYNQVRVIFDKYNAASLKSRVLINFELVTRVAHAQSSFQRLVYRSFCEEIVDIVNNFGTAN